MIFCLVIALSSTSAQSSDQPSDRPSDQTTNRPSELVREPKIVFIPGYYGSKISESIDERGRPRGEVFLTLGSILFGSNKLEMDAEINHTPRLVSSGLLDSVSVLPLIYSIDGYGETLQKVKREAKKFGIGGSQDVFVFDYDWRSDPVSILKRFDEKLAAWGLNHKQHNILIVAHSMGAWLMSYWLRYGSQSPETAVENWHGLEMVSRVMLVAAPFRGTLSIFRNSFWGAPGLPNDSLLGPKAISSFPSTYYLTPSEAELRTDSGLERTLDLKDPDVWEKNQWGAIKEVTEDDEKRQAAIQFVNFHVRQSKLFQDKIHSALSQVKRDKQDHVHSRFAEKQLTVYVGQGFKTNEIGIEIGHSPLRFAFTEKQIRRTAPKFSDMNTNVDGDETVSTVSAAAPRYIVELGGRTVQKNAAHLEILRDGSHIDWETFFRGVGVK